jgi:hypothetical protein
MFKNFNLFLNDIFWQILNARIMKVLLKKLSWFLKIFSKTFVEYSKNKVVKKTTQRGECGSYYCICTLITHLIFSSLKIVKGKQLDY